MKKIILLFVASFLLATVSFAQKTFQASITSSTNVLCNGDSTGSATVTALNGSAQYTYLWMPDGGTNATASNLSAGIYTVMVTDNTTANDTVYAYDTISQPKKLTINPISRHNVTCPYDTNGSATIDVTGGTTSYEYSWSNGATTAYDSNLSAGTYTVTVTDGNGCTISKTISILVLSNLSATPIVGNVSCFGNFNGIAIANVSGGTTPYTYLWEPAGDTTATATGLSAGTYILQVTDSAGCRVSSVAGITQPPPLVLTLHAIDSMAYAFAVGGVPPYTYNWSPPVSTTSIATGLTPGTYTVTVTDSNLCSDRAIVNIDSTNLNLILTDGNLECASYPGRPSYFNFIIQAYSSPAAIFNNCVVDIRPGAQFWGDSVSNGGIVVTQGVGFRYIPGANDYTAPTVINLPDSTIQITFGSPIDSSPHGTVIDTTPVSLFYVQLQLQGCQPSTVTFANTDSTAFQSYYTLTYNTTINHIDSIVRDTLCCLHNCDTLCNPHNCNPILLWNNITSSYDTSWTICYDTCLYPCYDTLKYYKVDTVFNYFSKNLAYNATNYAGGISPGATCPMQIGDFTHTINAGTNAKSVSPDPSYIPNNSSILAIEGYGFGNYGKIMVCNADSGFDGKGGEAYIPLDSTDILRWTDTWIKVRMPSVIKAAGGHTPGSGPIIVYNACGEYASLSSLAVTSLQINYSIMDDAITTPHTIKKYRPDVVMVKTLPADTTSFDWRCDTSVSNHPKALACVKKALREWNCYTGINWKLGADTNGITTKHDYISCIYFAPSSSFLTGASAATHSWYYYSTCADYTDTVTFTDEADMAINSSLNWSYDTTGIDFSRDSVYFYDNVLHEMGHALGLGHINDTLSLMYWYTAQNFRPFITSQGPYIPGPATLLGAMDMIYTSVLPANAPVNLGCIAFKQLDTNSRYCIDPTLSVSVIPDNSYSLNLFPNPINTGDLTIAYQLTQDSYIEFRILDCTGRVIMKLDDEHKTAGDYSQKVNISNLAGGVYLFTANINGQCQTIEFIKI